MSIPIFSDSNEVLKIGIDGVVQPLDAYDAVRLFVTTKGDKLVQKYSTIAADIAGDYKECTLITEAPVDGIYTDRVEYSIYREDTQGLRGSDELYVTALFAFDDTDFKDNRFVETFSGCIGTVCPTTLHTDDANI